jgi:hypothetical protein
LQPAAPLAVLRGTQGGIQKTDADGGSEDERRLKWEWFCVGVVFNGSIPSVLRTSVIFASGELIGIRIRHPGLAKSSESHCQMQNQPSKGKKGHSIASWRNPTSLYQKMLLMYEERDKSVTPTTVHQMRPKGEDVLRIASGHHGLGRGGKSDSCKILKRPVRFICEEANRHN